MNYTYAATLVRVIDGDTCVLDVDLGFRVHFHAVIRLARINAPELRDEGGPAARESLEGMLWEETFTLRSIGKIKADPYGRWIGELVLDDGTNVSEAMVVTGHAAHKDYR